MISCYILFYLFSLDFLELFKELRNDGIEDKEDFFTYFKWFLYIIPMFLISFILQVYIIFFTARTYRTAEKGKPEPFTKYIEEFVMFFFPFVGLWIIQPKLNEWAEEEFGDYGIMS